MPSVLLEDLTWQQAEQVLTASTIVVIPLGAAAKEHGPHLKLNNDYLIADYFKEFFLTQSEFPVVIAPTVAYHYYPAFVEYPGSISLRKETARDLIIDICTSLASFGPKRFYVLNTGISTIGPLQTASEHLQQQGILLHYTDLSANDDLIEFLEQPGGSHADEGETSMMLVIAPDTVDMSAAVDDYHPGAGPLTRVKQAGRLFSASGIYGHATLANREKGEKIISSYKANLIDDLRRLKEANLL